MSVNGTVPQDAIEVNFESLLIRALREADKADKLLSTAESYIGGSSAVDSRIRIAEARIRLMREYTAMAQVLSHRAR